ncbi:MAG: hypothetical protein AAF184_22070 [Pseudomonadota bacterium]
MRHRTALPAALASLLITAPSYAVDPLSNTAPDTGVAGVEWVRQTLASGFDSTELTPIAWSQAPDRAGSLGGTVSVTSIQSASADVVTPAMAEVDSLEEVVAVGVRERDPEQRQWDLPIAEEPENDWHRREGSVRTDSGRVAVGRAVVFQDVSDRRRYDAHRDEYRDPRPQQSVSVGVLGGRRAQD